MAWGVNTEDIHAFSPKAPLKYTHSANLRTVSGRVRRWAWVATAGAVASVALWLLSWSPTVTLSLAPDAIRHVSGQQFAVDMATLARAGFEVPGDTNEAPGRSTLVLLRDGTALGPSHAMHALIADHGGGSYSHWGNALLFSSPDGTDPRESPARYSVSARAQPTGLTRFIALVAAAASGLWLVRVARLGWVTAAKLCAIATVFSLAPRFAAGAAASEIVRLQTSGQYALLLVYVVVVGCAAVAAATAPFLDRWLMRAGVGLPFLVGFTADQAMRAVSGGALEQAMTTTLVRELGMATTVLPEYLSSIGPALVMGLVLLVAYVLPPRGRALPWSVGVTGGIALGGAVLLNTTGMRPAPALPPSVALAGQLAVAVTPENPAATARLPVSYARAISPRARTIVFVVDESVRGDVLGINTHRFDNTPFLESLGPSLVNFGLATSATNCSAASRVILRLGLRAEQLPDGADVWRTAPTIWQYARHGGFGSTLIDAWERLHSYMDAAEVAQVDRFVRVTDAPDHERDRRVVEILAEELRRGDGYRLIYVNKFGIHPPYTDKVPVELAYEPPQDVAAPHLERRRQQDVRAYHRALRWSVDAFLEKTWSAMDEETVLVYTSDHGQSLYEGGYDLSHCSLVPTAHRGEVRVPLLALTKDPQLRRDLAAAAANHRDRTDHFALFATVLELMGYERRWAEHEYGPGLFSAPRHGPRRFLVGTFNERSSYWLDAE